MAPVRNTPTIIISVIIIFLFSQFFCNFKSKIDKICQ